MVAQSDRSSGENEKPRMLHKLAVPPFRNALISKSREQSHNPHFISLCFPCTTSVSKQSPVQYLLVFCYAGKYWKEAFDHIGLITMG